MEWCKVNHIKFLPHSKQTFLLLYASHSSAINVAYVSQFSKFSVLFQLFRFPEKHRKHLWTSVQIGNGSGRAFIIKHIFNMVNSHLSLRTSYYRNFLFIYSKLQKENEEGQTMLTPSRRIKFIQ